jgi:hypothetical protein
MRYWIQLRYGCCVTWLLLQMTVHLLSGNLDFEWFDLITVVTLHQADP